MVTFNVYDRVFFVRGREYGTAFALNVDGRQYIISARHVIGDGARPSSLSVLLNKQLIELPVTWIGEGKGEIDISVLSPSRPIIEDVPFETSLGVVVGQDVYYVGFPLMLWANGGELMRGRPLPFVKRGTLSAGWNWDAESTSKSVFVDTISTKGFSGGPLVFVDHATGLLKLAGVVAKYKTTYEKVLERTGAETGNEVELNTGLMLAYGINHALDIIRANPTGLPVAR